MNFKIETNGFNNHSDVFKRHVSERIPLEFSDDGMKIIFCVDKEIGANESYQISQIEGGWKITGADNEGLFYGIGKFLHTAVWSNCDFTPNPPLDVITPACDFRAAYFAVHFYNWYQNAPLDEMENYIEDLMLWGYSSILAILPIINLETFEDDLFFSSVDRISKLFKIAKKLGMKVGLLFCVNQGLKSAPEEFDADFSYNLQFRGKFGRNLCLSKPDAFQYMRNVWKVCLEQFKDIGLDYVLTWPYDEGGCGCKDCRPWGANKYCDGCIGVREETLKLYPNAKFIVSTWTFDMPDDEGEYEGLYKRLKGDMSWVDYLMVDAHGDFPHYPLEHELIKPVVNFPEISMWALSPWGGFGASPLPERFQKLWDSSKRILSGGMPYSEGIYEDISKIQCVSYYWEPDRNYRDILSEYISYEYSNEVVDDVIEMIACIEKNHTAVSDGKKPDLNLALHGKTLADSVNECLCERAKKAWRWRILYIRGILDYKRYSRYIENDNRESETLDKLIKFSGEYLIEDRKAQELFKELQGYYHCVPYNGENAWTLPPLGGFYWLKKS